VNDRPRASGDAKWDAAVQAVAESRRRVAAMLREGAILSLDDDLLVLGFAPGHRAFVDHLGAPEVKSLVEAAMERAFGRRIELQLAVADPTMASDEGGGRASAVPEAALRERAAADPAVRAVTDLFRARLVEVRPAPKGQPMLEEAPPE
jgi:hypothetical protein